MEMLKTGIPNRSRGVMRLAVFPNVTYYIHKFPFCGIIRMF